MRILPVLALFALGCGAATPTSRVESADPALDWALLLPVETDGLVRVDLARVRRSPHRSSVQPVFDELLMEVAQPSMRDGLGGLLDRTDVVLLGLIPPATGMGDEVIVLARGKYRPDEVSHMAAGERAALVAGHQVWVQRDDGVALAQLRPDTIAMTANFDRMQRLIARTRMPPGPPRWPPALRALVEAADLERSTIGIALANRGVAPEGELMAMTMAGTADMDGALDIELFVELGDPTLAALATVFFEALLQELAASTEGEAFALGELAELTRFETVGTRIRGSIHAEPRRAEQLVPGLMGFLRDGFDEPEVPTLASPLAPTPA